jgi:hypothetical protein
VLHAALAEFGKRVPRGRLFSEEAAGIALYRGALEAVGQYWSGDGHGVGFDPAPRALVLPPAARVVHVVPADGATAPRLLEPIAPAIAAIGADEGGDFVETVYAVAPRARRSRLGAMQRPPLDGPVDLRLA